MHFVQFFKNLLGGQYHQLIHCDPKSVFSIWLWKHDDQGQLKDPMQCQNLCHFALFEGNDCSKSIEKDKFINSGISKYSKF